MESPENNVPVASPEYEQTAEERSAIQSFRRRIAKSPSIKILQKKGVSQLMPDHVDVVVGAASLANATGANDLFFLGGMLKQLCKASLKNGVPDEEGLNFMLSVVKGIEPRDQIEAMLAAQLAVLHVEIMKTASRLADAQHLQQRESAERAIGRLIRNFGAIADTIKRHRAGGEQKLTVQQVNVGDGGQAIVGNVTQASPSDGSNKPAASTENLSQPIADESTEVPHEPRA